MCDEFTSSMFSVSFVLSYFFFQENCRAFRTISFTPLKLLSPYILFCFTFLIIFQNKEYLTEKIKIQKTEAFHHAIIDPRPSKEACVSLLPVLVASPAIAIDKR